MRVFFSLLCLAVVLSVTNPAQAQLRADERSGSVPTQLYDAGQATSDLLSTIFSDQHFRMSHTYEASFSSFGGQAASMGMYTNSMMWQFNQAWAARVDVSVAHPFSATSGFGQDQQAKVFLRNAEVAYRPSENMQVRLQIRQSPYGRYGSPYGYHSPYRGAFSQQSAPSGDLFWRN